MHARLKTSKKLDALKQISVVTMLTVVVYFIFHYFLAIAETNEDINRTETIWYNFYISSTLEINGEGTDDGNISRTVMFICILIGVLLMWWFIRSQCRKDRRQTYAYGSSP